MTQQRAPIEGTEVKRTLGRQALAVLGTLLVAWTVSAALSLWLWRYNALIAGAVGLLLLLGGALSLPERTVIRHAASVGFVLGFATASWYFLMP
jgi:hypothetical protein